MAILVDCADFPVSPRLLAVGAVSLALASFVGQGFKEQIEVGLGLVIFSLALLSTSSGRALGKDWCEGAP